MSCGYKIIINRAGKKGDKVVAHPERIFDSYAEIDAFMDALYPGCWYSSNLVEKPDVKPNTRADIWKNPDLLNDPPDQAYIDALLKEDEDGAK